ncbi:MAG TPA: hypothetical protein VFX03_14490, partial [Thermomicrobiales bacterium]|nr:hypothetical protein [Thermomicrobiales bacterium]
MSAFTAETSIARPWLALAGRNAARIAAFAFLVALWSAALLLAERRIAGALIAPLGPLALWATATISAASAAAYRFFLRQAGPALRWSSSAALGMLGASLWLPGTNLWAIAGFWAIVIAEESWSHGLGRWQSV